MFSRLDGLDRGSSSRLRVSQHLVLRSALVELCHQLHSLSCLFIIEIIVTVPLIELPCHRQLALVAAIAEGANARNRGWHSRRKLTGYLRCLPKRGDVHSLLSTVGLPTNHRL